jgi:hypothetical protein
LIDGGEDARAMKLRSVTANVPASTAYQDEGPIATATVPPAMGPMIEPNVQRNVESDEAAASWSCGTILGMIESSDGRCKPSALAKMTTVTKSTQTLAGPMMAFTSRPAVPSSMKASVQMIILRLSTASASAPPRIPKMMSGTISTAPRSPTFVTEPVSSFIW